MLEPGAVLGPLEATITRSGAVRYAGAATDFNEIHYDEAAARAIGLPGVVAHGMWTMGAALRVVLDEVGDPAAIISYRARFVRPVVIGPDGARVEFSARVRGVADGVATLSLTATSAGQDVLGGARVEVRVG